MIQQCEASDPDHPLCEEIAPDDLLLQVWWSSIRKPYHYPIISQIYVCPPPPPLFNDKTSVAPPPEHQKKCYPSPRMCRPYCIIWVLLLSVYSSHSPTVLPNSSSHLIDPTPTVESIGMWHLTQPPMWKISNSPSQCDKFLVAPYSVSPRKIPVLSVNSLFWFTDFCRIFGFDGNLKVW